MGKTSRKRMKAAFQTTAPQTRKSRVSVGTVKSHCKIVSENREIAVKFTVTPQSCGKLWHSRGHCKHTLCKSAYHSGNTCTLHLPTTGHMSHCEHRGTYVHAQRNKCSLKCNGKKSRRALCVRYVGVPVGALLWDASMTTKTPVPTRTCLVTLTV